MDNDSSQQCRLCFEKSVDSVNVFEKFQNSTIASILAKHFWFQAHKNDGMSEWLCQMCWIHTRTFHNFYKRVEIRHGHYCRSNDSITSLIKQEPRQEKSTREKSLDKLDWNLVKHETEIETTAQISDLLTNKEDEISENKKYDDDTSCEESEKSPALDEEQTSTQLLKNKNNEDDCNAENVRQKSKTAAKIWLSPAERKKQDAQIREMFNMKCDLCTIDNVVFESLLKAKQHYRTVHNITGYLTCCGKKFHRRDMILNHLRNHGDPDPKNCNWHSPAEKVKQDAQIRELFNMKCDLCTDDDVVFESLLRARQHYRTVHKISGYLTCCGKKFHRRHLILNHIRNHVDPDAYRCEQCGKRFQNKFRLRNHIDNHVPLDSRAHKCSLCPSSFARQSLLRLHMKSKHESKTGEDFPCEKCGKNFRSSLLLSCHIRGVHEFSLEHVCETCARVFKTKQILQNHIFCEHTETPKVQCNVCGAWLKHEISLRAHLKRYHDASFEAVNCPICSKEVPSKHSLAGHIRSVHGEKEHSCSFCSKAFKTAKKLKEHIACHTGEDLYDCPYCDKKFRSSGNLYAHRKKAHLTEWSRDRANSSMEQSGGVEVTAKLVANDR